MKTFQDFDTFKKRLQKGVDWDDYIKVNDRIYKMVEYGEGYSNDYMLFQNRPTRKMIQVEYHCPSYKNGKQVKEYRFLDAFEYENDFLYRY